jgi:outer membrane protein TolC
LLVVIDRPAGFLHGGASGYGNHVIKVTTRAARKLLWLREGCALLFAASRWRRVWAGLTVVLCALCLAEAALAASNTGKQPQGFGYFDFATCARYALVHSEPFLKSRLDIQVSSADLKDAHAELLPTLQLVTKLYLMRPANSGFNSGNASNPLTVEMSVPAWDPFVALVKIKSQKILVDMAKTSHMNKVSEGFAEIAKLFYRVHVIDRLMQARRQMSAIHREKVEYGNSRLKQGSTEPLEVKGWENLLKAENLKLQDLERERQDRLDELKRFMGYGPDYELPLDTRDAANQILEGFNGQFVTYADIQALNRMLKLAAKQEQLQSNTVAGTYLAILPKPLLEISGLSNVPNQASGTYVALGVNYTVWDGFKRVRDIKRQKMKAEQAAIDRTNKSRDLYNKYTHLLGELRGLQAKDALLREKASLAEMGEERAFMLYKQGKTPGESMGRSPGRLPGDSQTTNQPLPRDLYANYLDKRVEKAEAALESIANVQERVMTLIDLATLAGGLERYNARIRY